MGENFMGVHMFGFFHKRQAPKDNCTMRAVLQHGINLTMAAAIDLSDDDLLVSADVPVQMGTQVTLYPALEDMETDLFELRGEVVKCYENHLASTFGDNRFHMGVRLEMDTEQRVALAKLAGKQLN